MSPWREWSKLSNLQINVVALGNFGNLQSQLGALSAQIAAVNQQLAKTGTALSIPQMRNMSAAFDDVMMRSGQFTKETVKMSSAAEQLGTRIAKNRVTFRDVAGALGNLNKQTSLYNQLGQQQVRMSRSVVQGIGGGMANVYTAAASGMESASVRAQVLRESVMASNAALKAASTQVINFGKNTQWAGRQLTAGLSMPLVLFGGLMAAQFYEIDKNLTRLSMVYGVGLEQATTAQLGVIRNEIMKTSNELANSLGVSAQVTTDLAAELAAAGLTGQQLIDSTKQAARITVLGEVDKQEAVKATIALQTAYKLNTQELTDAVNFFNAAQAATSTNMQDLVEAVPKVGPVIKGLGGSYKDLVAILTSMKEGGVPAGEAANAIKNSLGRIINPAGSAQEKMMAFGINLKEIVSKNAGDLIGTLTELQDKLDGLTNLQRSQAISEIFGKYQFARMTAFFDNFNKSGTQSAKVMQMMGMSSKQLEDVAKRQEELIQQSASGKFQIALQKAQQSLLPVGSSFLSAFTEVLDVVNKIVGFIERLPDGAKSFLKFGAAATIIIGPLVMATGLFANLLGTVAKGAINFRIFSSALKMGMNPLAALTSGYRLLTPSIVATEGAAAVFGTSMGTIAAASQTTTRAIMAQITALQQLQATLARMPAAPGMAAPANGRPTSPRIPFVRRSQGTPSRMPGETGRLPGFGGGDIIPALLEPGEFVVNKKSTQENLGILHQINQGKVRKFSVGTDLNDITSRSAAAGIESQLTDNEKQIQNFFKERKTQIRTSSPDTKTSVSDAPSNLRNITDKNIKGHVVDQSSAIKQVFEGLDKKTQASLIEDANRNYPAGTRFDKLTIPPEGITSNNFHKYLSLITRNWSGQIMPMSDGVNSLLNNMDERNTSDEKLQSRLSEAKRTILASRLFTGRGAEHFRDIPEMRQLAAQGAPLDARTVEKLYNYALATKEIEKEKPHFPIYSKALSSLETYVDKSSGTMSSVLPDLLESYAARKDTYQPAEREILRQVSMMIKQGAPQEEISRFLTKSFSQSVLSGNLETFILGPGDSTKTAQERDPKSMLGRDQLLASQRGDRLITRPGMVGGTYYSDLTLGNPLALSRYPQLNFEPDTMKWLPWVGESPHSYSSSFTQSRMYMGRLPGSTAWNPLGAAPRRFYAGGGMVAPGSTFLGMPRLSADLMKAKELKTTLAKTNLEATTGRFANIPVSDLGQRMQSIGGRSSAIPGINGVYEQNGVRYVVKTHDTADSALTELRGTQLTRDVFGLQTPAQELIKIKHPTTGDVVFAVRSPYDEKFATSTGKIEKDGFFDQALSAIIRRDKDLQPDNLYGKVVTDVGAGFVSNKASQPRVVGEPLPSVSDQAAINFLMSKGGAKKWFTENTAGIAKGMTEKEYVEGFRLAIKNASSKVNQSIDELPYLTATEKKMYSRLVDDLDDAAKLDWSSIYKFHKQVVPEVKKPPTPAATAKKEALAAEKTRQQGSMAPWEYGMPYRFATGGKIPGFGGGDIVPAMVEPGEFIVNKNESKKFAPLLHAINSGNYKKLSDGTPSTGQPSPRRKPNLPRSGRFEIDPFEDNAPRERGARRVRGTPIDYDTWNNLRSGASRRARGLWDRIGNSETLSRMTSNSLYGPNSGIKVVPNNMTDEAEKARQQRILQLQYKSDKSEAEKKEHDKLIKQSKTYREKYAAAADARIKAEKESTSATQDSTKQKNEMTAQEKEAAKQARRQSFAQKGQGIGMAAMMGSGTVMQMTGGGNAALNYALMAGGAGMMIHPVVGLVMAAMGGLAGFIQTSVEEMNKEIEARQSLVETMHRSVSRLSSLEQDFLNVKSEDLLSMDTSMLDTTLIRSTDQLRSFTQALKDAEEGTVENSRVKSFSEANTAEDLLSSPAFASLVNQSIGSGVSEKKTIEMLMGYLNAANKLEFAPAAQQYVDSAYGGGGKNKFVDASGVNRRFDPANFALYSKQAGEAAGNLSSQGIEIQKALDYSQSQANYDKLSSEMGSVTAMGGSQSFGSVMGLLQSPAMLQGLMSMYLTAKANSEFTSNAMGGGVITGLGFGGKDFLENPDQGKEYIVKLVEDVLTPALGKDGIMGALGSLGMGDKVGGVTGYGGSDESLGGVQIGTSGEFQNILVDYMKGTLNLEESNVPFREAVVAAAELADSLGITADEILLSGQKIGNDIGTQGGGPNGVENQQAFTSRFLEQAGLGTGWEGMGPEAINSIIEANVSGMEKINASMQMLQSAMENTSGDALSNLNGLTKGFQEGLINASNDTKQVFNANIDAILTKLGPEARNTFDQLESQTGNWRIALMGLKVVLSDIGYGLNDLNNMSDIQIKTIINRVERSTTGGMAPTTLPSADEVSSREAAAAYDSGGGSSGGGSPDTSGIDKQVEALQKKIDQIRLEREEIAKLNAEYQKNMEFQQRRLDLENQMREALAGGNLLQYAQLQQEKQAMDAQKQADDAQEKGDKRAENRIKDLEDQIAKLQKKKSDMSSGGSSGGGGSTQEEEKPKPPYDTATISASISALATPFATIKEFLNSDAVKPYIDMLKELGYTNGEITREIAYQWNVARQSIVDDYSNLQETMNQTKDYLTMQSLEFRNFTDEAKDGIAQTLTTIMLNPENTKDSALAKMQQYLQEIGAVDGPRAKEIVKEIFGFYTQGNDGGPRDVTMDMSDTSKQVDKIINEIIQKFPINGKKEEIEKLTSQIGESIRQTYADSLSRGLPRAEFKENLQSTLEELLIPEESDGSVRKGWEDAIGMYLDEGIGAIKNWPLENVGIQMSMKQLKQKISSDLTKEIDLVRDASVSSSLIPNIYIEEDKIKEVTDNFVKVYGKNLKEGMDQEHALRGARNSLIASLIANDIDPELAANMARRVYQAARKEIEKSKPIDWKIKVKTTSTDLSNAADGGYYGTTTTGSTEPISRVTTEQVLIGARAADGSLRVTVVNPSDGAPIPTPGARYVPTGRGGPGVPPTTTTVEVGSGKTAITPTMASGGSVSGPGSWTSDSIPAMLSNGEYVVQAKSVAKYGHGFMDSVNAGRYANGGPVGFAEGGAVSGTTAFVNVVVSGVTAGTTWMSSMAQGMASAAGLVQEALKTNVKFGVPEGIRSGIDWVTGLSQAVVSGAINVYTSFQVIMEGIKIRTQNNANQIMAILEKSLGQGYKFDIFGTPKLLVKTGTDDLWSKVMPTYWELLAGTDAIQFYKEGGRVLPPEFRGGTFNKNGSVRGPGGPTDDKIPAMLSDGEFVVRASSVKQYGLETLNSLNNGTLSFADGGFVKLFEGSPLGEALSNYATQFTGTPYVASSYNQNTGPLSEGGTGWGCATAMEWLYRNFYGIGLPNSSLSAAQMSGLSTVVPEGDMSQWLPADLLYFYYKNGVNTNLPVNHTGMYLGNSQIFHAQGNGIGQETNISSVDTGNLKGVRRVLPPASGGIQWPYASGFRYGGQSIGPGGPTDDKIPAMLSNGEFVLRAGAVSKYGVDFMRALNQGVLDPEILQSARARTFSSPTMNDTMVKASDAKITTINNEFNITGDDPRAIAEEVVKVLNIQQQRIGARTRI